MCSLISACHCEDTKSENVVCDFYVDAASTNTLNCSKRELATIPATWPKKLQELGEDDHVLLTFNSNKIKKLTQLDIVRGSRIALILKANSINEIVDDAFKNLQNMVYLDLSNNTITGDILRSEIFQGPYKDGVYAEIALETLNIGYNKIHSVDKDLFKYTPNLTRLYMNNNPIEILDHVTILALNSAVKLEILDLAYTEIESIPLNAFKDLINLKEIDLSGNRFTMVPESLRYVGETLEYLSFNNNPIVELNDDSFIGLSNLKVLEVAENEDLEEVKSNTFTPLTSLKTLHLCHNEMLRYISHNAFRVMKNLWTLKEVYLDDNNLRELPVDLMPWEKLEVLGMTGNDWLCNCDLANIIITQSAGKKFNKDEVPYCTSPSKLYGSLLTDIPMENCPTDPESTPKQSFLASLKPKHVLWSILGVALIVLIGMGAGLLVNSIKLYVRNRESHQSIRYVNLHNKNTDSSFA